MTEKRYFYKINNNGALIIIDKTENILIRDMYRACDLLNAQHEEIQELRKESYGNLDGLNYYQVSELECENEQLKQTIKEVCELLEEEVDVFSEKATEHDICAYIELKEFDNKDAYYMATATKKAIKMLKGDVE